MREIKNPAYSRKMLFAIFSKYVKVTATHQETLTGIHVVSTHALCNCLSFAFDIFLAGAKPAGIGLFLASQME
jgi:hypothetical protein